MSEFSECHDENRNKNLNIRRIYVEKVQNLGAQKNR